MPEPSHIDLRIRQLQMQIATSVNELYDLVNPTSDEQEQVWDDCWELSGPEYDVIEALDESLRVLSFREVVKERSKSDEQTNG